MPLHTHCPNISRDNSALRQIDATQRAMKVVFSNLRCDIGAALGDVRFVPLGRTYHGQPTDVRLVPEAENRLRTGRTATRHTRYFGGSGKG